jgi:hypothetical protein
MLQAILDAVRGVGQNLFAWMQSLLFTLWGYIWDQIVDQLSFIPWPQLELPVPSATIIGYARMANYWIPLEEGATLLGVYVTLLLIFMPIRIVLRHLPVIGG